MVDTMPVNKSNTAFYCINSIKCQLLVFLHVFVVCKRNSLHGCEHGSQCTVDTACFASYQFCNIRILFLRHDTASCAVGIINLHKAVFIGVPENDFLAETAEMHHNCGHGRKKFDHIISVRYGIHTVSGRSVKARAALQYKICPADKWFLQAHLLQADRYSYVLRISAIRLLSLRNISKYAPYMMCQCNRLCFLQMRKSRHICVHIILHDHLKSFQKLLQFCINLFDLITHIQVSYQERPGHYDFFLYEASYPDLRYGRSDLLLQSCEYLHTLT